MKQIIFTDYDSVNSPHLVFILFIFFHSLISMSIISVLFID